MDRDQMKAVRKRFLEKFSGFDEKGRMRPGLIEGGDGVPVHMAGLSDSAHSAQDIMAQQYTGYVPGEDALFLGYAVANADNYGEAEPDQVLLTFPRVFEGVKVFYAERGAIRALSQGGS